MKCIKCGNNIFKDDNFCTNCGTKTDNYIDDSKEYKSSRALTILIDDIRLIVPLAIILFGLLLLIIIVKNLSFADVFNNVIGWF